MSKTLILSALDLLKTGDFQLGAELEKSHEICQDREGTPIFDWVHALIHRIEGDEANAGYWYQRAGKTRHMGTIPEEWAIIRAEAETR